MSKPKGYRQASKATLLTVALAMPFSSLDFAYAEETMPIMFAGDWCFSSREKKATGYKLPSWSEDGICKKILSVNPWRFYSEGWGCEPIRIRQKKDCAPSGCAYIAQVIARCQPDGTVTRGQERTFEFSRYKGSLDVEEK